MKATRMLVCISAAFLLTPITQTLAKTSSGDAARLGASLTPVGAERAGNAAGTIPEWSGGLSVSPGGAGSNPFADDKVLFQVTSSNYSKYSALLSAGQRAMFARYPSYRMDVYPTRRSASFPQWFYDATQKNATECELVAEGEGIRNCAQGLPFPVPKDAYELIWNHKLKYKGTTLVRYNDYATVTASGAYSLHRLREQVLGLYYLPGNTSENIGNVLLYFRQEVLAPPRLAGEVLLVHETLNAAAQPRQAWIYNPGQRRVRRAPDVAYDNPATGTDGLKTNDMTDMFNGAMDRFTWTSLGKREMLVPYNSYGMHSSSTKVKDMLGRGHLNPDLQRYELHRVWVVEAKLKPGQRHINSRRTYYLDEDSYQILMADHYDGAGQLWRYSEAPSVNYSEVPVFWATVEVHYDLKSGRYIAGLLDNDDKPYDFSSKLTKADFSLQGLRDSGVR